MNQIRFHVLALFVAIVSTLSCTKGEGEDLAKDDLPAGYELKITTRGHVKDEIYVDVLSGENVESFGSTGAGPNGKDGGALVGFSPIKLGRELTVRWGVHGQDGLNMKHNCTFETSKLLPIAKQIRSLQLVFSGEENWELNAYDKPMSSQDKKLLVNIKPNKK